MGRAVGASCCGQTGATPSSPDDPIVIGSPNGYTVEVIAVLPVHGIAAGTTAWVSGDGVTELLGRYLVLI